LRQVFAVGRWVIVLSLYRHIIGFIDEKPRVGGREHEVTYSRKRDFSSQVNYRRTYQKAIIVSSLSW
jgi:hypothetical protein